MKRGIKGLEPAMKRFVHDHLRGRKPRRLHMCMKQIDLNTLKNKRQKIDHKPTGLWYGLGDSWINYCLNEVSGWICPYIYEVILHEDQLLKVSNVSEFEEFEDEYHGIPDHFKLIADRMPEFDLTYGSRTVGRRIRRMFDHIDFKKLAKTHGAVEIAPYIWNKRLESMWYYTWDCASGCVWKRKAIKELRLFAAYDKEQDDFIRIGLQQGKRKV